MNDRHSSSTFRFLDGNILIESKYPRNTNKVLHSYFVELFHNTLVRQTKLLHNFVVGLLKRHVSIQCKDVESRLLTEQKNTYGTAGWDRRDA